MRKAALIILDGWGKGDGSQGDGIASANTPFIDSCYDRYPNANLKTFGENVGLPEGQMGNSEVGHLNIGAGRIVYQDLVKINKAIRDGEFDKNPVLQETISYCVKNNKPLHLMGLVSDGGIHSHDAHLHHLIKVAVNAGVSEVFVHAFTDGRDCSPTSGKGHVQRLINVINQVNEQQERVAAQLVSVIGRYYAMDRDQRWGRIKEAYDLLLVGDGEHTMDLLAAIARSYGQEETDEFLKPKCLVDNAGIPIGRFRKDDAVICFNFRTDRCREITDVLTQRDMVDEGMLRIPLRYVTMTNYDNTFAGINVLFSKDNLEYTIGEVIANAGLSQVRIAETEKYPHVTYFFSGGRENEFDGETRLMVASPKVATYDLQPEMSALEVTSTICDEINTNQPDFVCLNFANPDMVGHTGVPEAILKAVETVDDCTKQVVEAALANDYSLVIIADHGNADKMVNDDGSPHTAHTTNLVPCFIIDKDNTWNAEEGILADVAPTILKLMGIDQPAAMTGSALIS